VPCFVNRVENEKTENSQQI